MEENVVRINAVWGGSAMATIARIVTSNPRVTLPMLKQHAAAAGLVSETTVDIYASTGPWEVSGEGDDLRLDFDPLGFGTEWESEGANSGRTLPTCEGAFFVEGAFPRWLLFSKDWYTSNGCTFVDLPLIAALHIATHAERGIALGPCCETANNFQATDLTCNARSAKLTLHGVAMPRGGQRRIMISVPLLGDLPLSIHSVPGCGETQNLEEYFDLLLRESGAESNPALGFATLVGFSHPNLGLAPGIESSDDQRGQAMTAIRRRLRLRAEDTDIESAALKTALSMGQNQHQASEAHERKAFLPDALHRPAANADSSQADPKFQSEGSFAPGSWVTHVSGFAAGKVIASDADTTSITNGSIRFTAKTRFFLKDIPVGRHSEPVMINGAASVEHASVSTPRIENTFGLVAAVKSDSQPKTPGMGNLRPLRKPTLSIELQIAERALKAYPANRGEYLKTVFHELRRYISPLGDFYLKRALQALRDGVCLTPKEAEAIWIALTTRR